ncbi:MAG: hypothetical protein V1793_00400 [Pseudomonadota bacterium]
MVERVALFLRRLDSFCFARFAADLWLANVFAPYVAFVSINEYGNKSHVIKLLSLIENSTFCQEKNE